VKIRADEHVSIEIVQAVRNIALSPGWDLSHVIEVGDRSAQDEHWATKFAREDGDAILSGDTDFFKRHQLVVAISRTGLKIIHMPAKWSNARGDQQAAHILSWWRRIETKIQLMSPRECFRVPWDISEAGELTKVRVDYQNAERRMKRQRQRAEQESHESQNVTSIEAARNGRGPRKA
jgi:predicted nuclease of predicted toxin-antitoxin system